MARKKKEAEPVGRDPVSHIPADGRWYPAEIRTGFWQGHRKWIDGKCMNAENDVVDEQNLRFESEADCQVRCDVLNQDLPE